MSVSASSPIRSEMIAQCGLAVQDTNVRLPFPPGKTELVVGREDPVSGIFPAIDLTDHGGDEGGVSRKHARIFIQGIQVFIEDLNSTNYTYVNQQKLAPEHPHQLNDGDEIRLGRVKLDFYTERMKAKE
jgi:pSer/pThr/pTyr-binding forkhead associated (FHA) protein